MLLLLSFYSGHCQRGQMYVSVLTSEPGQELYTLFGHTAIRIRNDSIRFDKVYNFGTFDFSSPFFYVNFIKGKLDYFLSVNNFNSFKHDAILEKRKIHEQLLDLTEAEKQRIYEQLEFTYHSPERFYRYDFFYDNCATRVRNVLFEEMETPIVFDTSSYCCKSFRQILKPYIQRNYWLNLGINLALGREADKTASFDDFMFLPDYIMYILKDSHVVLEESILLPVPVNDVKYHRISYVVPWVICTLFLFGSLWSKTRKPVFFLVTSVVGLLGLFLLFMGFFSDLRAFSENFNVYWTLPALVIPIIHTTYSGKIFQVTYVLFLVLLLILWGRIHAGLSVTFIPWILLLIAVMLADLEILGRNEKVVTLPEHSHRASSKIKSDNL